MFREGIGVNGFDNYVRVTIGDTTEMLKVVDSVREGLQGNRI